jgi:zinc D-Ala-D-Ala carboxypeptidase
MRNPWGRLGGTATALTLAGALLAPAGAVAAAADYEIESVSSLSVVVNKHRPLDPLTYVPESLTRSQDTRLRSEAAAAYKTMVRDAKRDGVNIVAISGYRSYQTQAELYEDYVQRYGQDTADTLAARPGHSEHQTGLAMDVGNASGECALQDCFAGTPVGQWVAEHAWKYGFIIRYPENEQDVTGYTYEPWHLRYVGPALAVELWCAARGSTSDPEVADVDTLEEFFGLEPAPEYLP